MNDVLVVSLQSLTKTDAGGTGRLGYYLAERLHRSGRLKHFIVSTKGNYQPPFPCKPVSRLSKYYLFLLNRIWNWGLMPYYVKRYLEELLFDFFLQFQIDNCCNVIISTNPYLARSLKRFHKKGIKTFFIPGNPEENELNDVMSRERLLWNVMSEDVYSYAPRIREYNRALPYFECIVAHSFTIEESFRKRRPNARIEACYGILWQQAVSKKNEQRSSKVLKVSYLAHTALLKGLQNLLAAWELSAFPDAELHIGGTIDKVVS